MASTSASLTDADVTKDQIIEIFKNEAGIRIGDATRMLTTLEDSFVFIPETINLISQKIKAKQNEQKYLLECVMFGEYNWDIGKLDDESTDKHSLLMQKYYFHLLFSFSKYPLLKQLRLWRNPIYPNTMKFISQLLTNYNYNTTTPKSNDINRINKDTTVFDFLGLTSNDKTDKTNINDTNFNDCNHKCECKLELIDMTFIYVKLLIFIVNH